jgi:hypothetical protein
VRTEQRGGNLQEDISVYLPHSVRDFLKDEMSNTPESLAVRFMLIKNYCSKLQLFYLKFKNATASSRLTDKDKE